MTSERLCMQIFSFGAQDIGLSFIEISIQDERDYSHLIVLNWVEEWDSLKTACEYQSICADVSLK